ncbi:MAG: ribose-phosphate pyrophosphokinase [Acidobacteriota bacterium]
MSELTLFSGNANRRLAEDIGRYLGVGLANVHLTRFSDGEIYCQILENARGRDVFIVQPTCPPVHRHLMELLIMIDALKRSSASRITAVIPYYGYARQDRKDKPRVPITSKLVADLISAAGASRILTMDLHAPQIQGFFDVPVDHLFAAPVIIDHVARMGLTDLTIVSPDAGGVERARAFAKRLNATLAIVDKRRVEANVAEVMHVIGDVEGRNIIITDDIIDTAGTITGTVLALKKAGCREVYVSCSHPVLSGPAIDRLNSSPVRAILTTDSIPLAEKKALCPKIEVLSVAPLLGEAIKRIHEETSVSSLFI